MSKRKGTRMYIPEYILEYGGKGIGQCPDVNCSLDNMVNRLSLLTFLNF